MTPREDAEKRLAKRFDHMDRLRPGDWDAFARIAADEIERVVYEDRVKYASVSAHNRAIAASKPLPWHVVARPEPKEEGEP